MEDHVETRDSLARLLARRGFKVLTAGTAEEARLQLAKTRVRLVISDIGLPDENGLELMRKLRREDPHLPAIALTEYGSEADIAKTREAGFAVHLVKPIHFKRLEQAIAVLLAPGEPQP